MRESKTRREISELRRLLEGPKVCGQETEPVRSPR